MESKHGKISEVTNKQLTDDREEGDAGEHCAPRNMPQNVFDSVHRSWGASQDEQLDVVDDQ